MYTCKNNFCSQTTCTCPQVDDSTYIQPPRYQLHYKPIAIAGRAPRSTRALSGVPDPQQTHLQHPWLALTGLNWCSTGGNRRELSREGNDMCTFQGCKLKHPALICTAPQMFCGAISTGTGTAHNPHSSPQTPLSRRGLFFCSPAKLQPIWFCFLLLTGSKLFHFSANTFLYFGSTFVCPFLVTGAMKEPLWVHQVMHQS